MSNVLDFILKLTDQLSPAMRSAASVADQASSKIVNDLQKTASGAKTMAYSLNDLKEKLNQLNSTRSTTKIVSDFRKATDEARKLENQINRLERRGSSGMGGGMSDLPTILSGAAVLAGARDSIMTGVAAQGQQRAINFTTNGRGNEATGFIKKQSAELGLDEQAGLSGFKTLSGGLRGLNMDLNDMLKIYSGVNKGIATYNLMGEESKRVYLALGQIASKGTVQAEELRGQIGEVIPGAFSIAAKAMGVTEKQLNKLMDDGKLMSKDFLPQFAAQMEKEFGQSAIDASTGAAANMNRFNNVLYDVKKTVAEELLPPFISFLSVLGSGFNIIMQNKDFFVPIIVGIGAVVIALTAWTIAQSILNATMWANPITPIIVGITLLAVGIYFLIKRFEGWGDSMKAIWEIIKSFTRMTVAAFVQFGEGIWYGIQYGWLKFKSFIEWIQGALANVGRAMQFVLTLEFGKAKDALFQEIVTPSSKALEQLEKNKNASVANYKALLAQESQNISAQSQKIGLKKVVSAKASSPLDQAPASPAGKNGGGGPLDGSTSTKADNINSGGSRPITINIGKQIESLNVHVMEAKEGAEEIAKMMREEIRRVLYSINGAANA